MKKKPKVKSVKLWAGFVDDKPYCNPGIKHITCYLNKTDAQTGFIDVRKVTISWLVEKNN